MRGALLSATLLLAVLRPAAADPVADFYRGRTLTILVGVAAGGTYDATARLVGRHLGRHIPGEPTIIVQNVLGAGGGNMILHLYNIAPHDGSVIGMAIRNYALEPVLYAAPRFDPQRFSPIGSTTSEVAVGVTWYTVPVKTFDDLFTHQITVGGTGGLDDTTRYPVIVRNLTDAKIKVVKGYPGGNDVTNAMEKGEVDGRFGWSWGSVKSRAAHWLRDRKINVLLQIGLHQAPDLPNVPLIMDYAKSERDRQALELLLAPQVFAWPLIAPPDVPADRLAALRAAFAQAMKDPEFIKDAERMALEIEPVGGEEIAALVQRILSFEPGVAKRALELQAEQ